MMFKRTVRKITAPEMQPGDEQHRVRLVLEPGNWEEYDPFLMMAEDWFRPGTFGDHPHRGIETITYIIEGSLSHRDNHGGKGLLGPGDAQWMTAGRGIIHAEEPPEFAHSLQLWLNLPSTHKMTEPRYQDLRGADVPMRREDGGIVKVFSGASGDIRSNTKNHVPVTMVEMELQPAAVVTQKLPASYNAFVYILSGSGYLGEERTEVNEPNVVWLTRTEDEGESEIRVEAKEPLRLLLWAGQPVREPVVARGPFVMNTVEEIRQAYEDFWEGKF